jgi:hypothetical protein
MAFPKRVLNVSPPEYDDLAFDIHANPTGADITALCAVDDATLGAALVKAYGGVKADGYGVTFDFSTPEAAMQTIQNPDLPADLRFWLRNAPLDVVDYVREDVTKKFKRSLGASSGA